MRRTIPSAMLLACLLAMPAAAGAAETRAEYVAQADPICKKANAKIGKLNDRVDELHDEERYKPAGRVLSRTGTVLARSVDRVRAIDPPPGDDALVANWLALVDRIAVNNTEMGKAEAGQRWKRWQRLRNRNAAIQAKAHAMVDDFGFSHCA